MTTELKAIDIGEIAAFQADIRYELVEGRLLEREMSTETTMIAGVIFRLLGNHCDAAGSGKALPDGASYRIFFDDPTAFRKPDVSWFSAARWNTTLKETTHIELAPDLIVEVVSPNDNAYEVTTKIRQFLDAGTKEAWIVYPESEELERRYADGTARWYTAHEEIDAAPLIPDFKWKLADVLAMA